MAAFLRSPLPTTGFDIQKQFNNNSTCEICGWFRVNCDLPPFRLSLPMASWAVFFIFCGLAATTLARSSQPGRTVAVSPTTHLPFIGAREKLTRSPLALLQAKKARSKRRTFARCTEPQGTFCERYNLDHLTCTSVGCCRRLHVCGPQIDRTG